MYNNNDSDEVGSGGSSSRAGIRRYRELQVDALSAEEWNYLRGLFLTDGKKLVEKGGAYRISFFLQGNEEELAHRVVQLLRRAGLKPWMKKDPHKDMWVVMTCSKALLDFLPAKNALKDDVKVRARFFEENDLFKVENGVPFLAGLLDGDGSCPINVAKKSCFGVANRWDWSLSQAKYPFLIDYVRKFVDALSSESNVKVSVYPNRRETRARIRKSGIVALLNSGIAEYSWKAEKWLERDAEIQDERMKYYTVGQVAKLFGVSRYIVLGWLDVGRVRCMRTHVRTRASHLSLSWRYILVSEVERFRSWLREEEEGIKKIKTEGVKLSDAAVMLGVPRSTLWGWHLQGRIRATLVREVRGGEGWKCWVIPRDEVERLKLELGKSDEC